MAIKYKWERGNELNIFRNVYMAIALFDGIDGTQYCQSFGRKGF
jgi:hypothetical protein